MPEITPSKWRTDAGWDDVPHITESAKKELLDGTMPHLRDARSKGIPSIGEGAIYPVPESEILVDPFKVPGYFKRCYGLDVGWRVTGAVWLAKDPDTGIYYLTTEHYRKQAEPSIHAAAIRARGEWIPGVIDPAARGRKQDDGNTLMQMYKDLGLNIMPARNDVEAGLYAVWELLSTGRLKVFRGCVNFMNEYRSYARDENGKIIKEDDHLMDALRYAVLSGIDIMCVEPVKPFGNSGSNIADKIAGY